MGVDWPPTFPGEGYAVCLIPTFTMHKCTSAVNFVSIKSSKSKVNLSWYANLPYIAARIVRWHAEAAPGSRSGFSYRHQNSSILGMPRVSLCSGEEGREKRVSPFSWEILAASLIKISSLIKEISRQAKSDDIWQSYHKNKKRWRFFWDTV